MKTHSFTAVVHKEDDMYVAECPEVGTIRFVTSIEVSYA
jgi:predicted RNase H-like HicB family nuclease